MHVTWEPSHDGAASGPIPRAPSGPSHDGAASGPIPRAPSGPCGEAAVLGLEGERITLSSTVPRAPGGKLVGGLESGSRLEVKVASCRKQGVVFTIEGRLIDATRALRAEIAALLPPGSGGPGPLRSSS